MSNPLPVKSYPPYPTTTHVEEVTIVTPDILCITVIDQPRTTGFLVNVTPEPSTPYTNWQYAINPNGEADLYVIMGKNKDWRRFQNQPARQYVDFSKVDDPAQWGTVGGKTVTYVGRKSLVWFGSGPSAVAKQAGDSFDNGAGIVATQTMRHHIFLKLSSALTVGQTVIVNTPSNSNLAVATFTFDDRVIRCKGINVGFAGFRPSDIYKEARLSCFAPGFPNAGNIDYSPYTGGGFEILDELGNTVASGRTITQVSDGIASDNTNQLSSPTPMMETVKTVTAVTVGYPPTIGVTAHGFSNGDSILSGLIAGPTGDIYHTGITSNNFGFAKNVTANTYEFQNGADTLFAFAGTFTFDGDILPNQIFDLYFGTRFQDTTHISVPYNTSSDQTMLDICAAIMAVRPAYTVTPSGTPYRVLNVSSNDPNNPFYIFVFQMLLNQIITKVNPHVAVRFDYNTSLARFGFDSDFASGNTFSITVNGIAVGPISYNTSQHQTMLDIQNAIITAGSTGGRNFGARIVTDELGPGLDRMMDVFSFVPASPANITLTAASVGGTGIKPVVTNGGYRFVWDSTSWLNFGQAGNSNRVYKTNAKNVNWVGAQTSAMIFTSADIPSEGFYKLRIPGLGVSDLFPYCEASSHYFLKTAFMGLYNQRVGDTLDTTINGGFPMKAYARNGVNGFATPMSYASLTFSTAPFFAGTYSHATYYGYPSATAGIVDGGMGHRDAGDADHFLCAHMSPLMQLLLPLSIYPSGITDIGIPQSFYKLSSSYPRELPDCVNEVLWIVDGYRRMQDASGWVPSGMQGSAYGGIYQNTFLSTNAEDTYPYPGFLTQCTWFVGGPDHLSTYCYVWGATRLAITLLGIGPKFTQLANDLIASAELAWNWCVDMENNPASRNSFSFYQKYRTNINFTANCVAGSATLTSVSSFTGLEVGMQLKASNLITLGAFGPVTSNTYIESMNVGAGTITLRGYEEIYAPTWLPTTTATASPFLAQISGGVSKQDYQIQQMYLGNLNNKRIEFSSLSAFVTGNSISGSINGHAFGPVAFNTNTDQTFIDIGTAIHTADTNVECIYLGGSRLLVTSDAVSSVDVVLTGLLVTGGASQATLAAVIPLGANAAGSGAFFKPSFIVAAAGALYRVTGGSNYKAVAETTVGNLLGEEIYGYFDYCFGPNPDPVKVASFKNSMINGINVISAGYAEKSGTAYPSLGPGTGVGAPGAWAIMADTFNLYDGIVDNTAIKLLQQTTKFMGGQFPGGYSLTSGFGPRFVSNVLESQSSAFGVISPAGLVPYAFQGITGGWVASPFQDFVGGSPASDLNENFLDIYYTNKTTMLFPSGFVTGNIINGAVNGHLITPVNFHTNTAITLADIAAAIVAADPTVTAAIASASFTGSISGTTLTASSVIDKIRTGDTVSGVGVTGGTTIIGQFTGITGGAGTYLVSASQTVGSEAMSTLSNVAITVSSSSIAVLAPWLLHFNVTAGASQTTVSYDNNGAYAMPYRTITPERYTLPAFENWFWVQSMILTMEFTIEQTNGGNAMVAAYCHLRPSVPLIAGTPPTRNPQGNTNTVLAKRMIGN